MKPFRLEVELKTPVVLGSRPLRLEGLLWHCLYLNYGCPDTAREKLHDYLQFNGRFFHASSCAFFARKEQRIAEDFLKGTAWGFDPKEAIKKPSRAAPIKEVIARDRSTVGAMRQEDLHEDLIAPFGKRKPYKKLELLGGKYRIRMNQWKAYWAESLVFHGVGNGGAIASLMEFYLVSIGVNASIGFGTIGRVRAMPERKDYSIVDPNRDLARPIPLDSDYQPRNPEKLLIEDALLMPPFRGEQGEPCYLPERIRTIYDDTSALDGA